MPATAPLDALVATGRSLFGAAACSVALLEPDEEHLLFVAAAGAGAGEVTGLRLPVNRGVAGWVVSSGQPIALHDVRRDPRFARDVAESTGYVPTAIAAAPIPGADDVVGVIEVLDPAPGGADTGLLGLLAVQAAALVAAAPQQGPDPALTAAVRAVARLGATEQQAAAALLRTFTGYVEARGGPSGLV